jgi:hypothetical protein
MNWPKGYLDPWSNIGMRLLGDDQIPMICNFAAANNLQDFIDEAECTKNRYNLGKLQWVLQHVIMQEEHHPAKLAEIGIDQTISLASAFGKIEMCRDRAGPPSPADDEPTSKP